LQLFGKELDSSEPAESPQSLVIFDGPNKNLVEDSRLVSLVKQRNVHVVIISASFMFPDSLKKSISDHLLRGTVLRDIQPLSTIHTTQRVVYSIVKDNHLAPSKKEQLTFEKLAQFTNGSPDIVDVVSALLSSHLDDNGNVLTFADLVRLNELGPSTKPPTVIDSDQTLEVPTVCVARHMEKRVYDAIPAVQESKDPNPWATSSHYDSWQVMTVLIERCNLVAEERLLLNCLSVLNHTPVPAPLVSGVSAMICKASHMPFLASSLATKLVRMSLLKPYPKPLVYSPNAHSGTSDIDFFYVPKFVAEALWKDVMTGPDKAMALAILYKTLNNIVQQSLSIERKFLIGTCSILLKQFECNFTLVGKECYQEVYRFFLALTSSTL
jgi:hypothetical protein